MGGVHDHQAFQQKGVTETRTGWARRQLHFWANNGNEPTAKKKEMTLLEISFVTERADRGGKYASGANPTTVFLPRWKDLCN